MKKEKIIIIINVFLLIAAVTFSVLFGITLSQKNTLQTNYDELNTKYEELEKNKRYACKSACGHLCIC